MAFSVGVRNRLHRRAWKRWGGLKCIPEAGWWFQVSSTKSCKCNQTLSNDGSANDSARGVAQPVAQRHVHANSGFTREQGMDLARCACAT